ncbi:DUF6248 family natural product biosynthesis protein [Streptomyces sp. NPDC051561]|uniref:DUF6248 family natural product biosynthesis protein n=1 Tax=Streptomyces sp. NPDC051561 TaxID=3365658 RepID=UPI0037B2AFED
MPVSENHHQARPVAPARTTAVETARQAAALAVAAADTAMHAASHAPCGQSAHREDAMHAAHKEACESERYARLAQDPSGDEHRRARYAALAVEAAVRAQTAAGTETTAAALRTRPERPATAEQRAWRAQWESAARAQETQEEARARAVTGMDSDNRDREARNRDLAEDFVSALGWTIGHLRVVEAAATGRLFWRGGRARLASRPGVRDGGRLVSKDRTLPLYAARFLVAAGHDDGVRQLTLSPMGERALALVRLHPAGLYPDDRAAYEARYTLSAKRWMSSDQKKAAARRLPPLDHLALRFYRRPVTLAEQEERAGREAQEQWEDEGGYCPGVPTPSPVAAPAAPRPPAAARPEAAPRTAPAAATAHRWPVVRRPQRTLTHRELAAVRRTPLLNLHGALLMGITDPVPNPSPMPEPEGEWVRRRVWPEHYLEIDRKYPFGFWRWSTCERGTCWNCLASRCEWCVHRQKGGPHVDSSTDWVHNHHGQAVAPLLLRAGGTPCIWWCRCPCPKEPSAAKPRRGRPRRTEHPAGARAAAPAKDGPPTPAAAAAGARQEDTAPGWVPGTLF